MVMSQEKFDLMFMSYLEKNNGVSNNTVQAYKNDISYFCDFLACSKMMVLDATVDTIEAFKIKMKNDGKAVSSVSRALSTVRAFYTFLIHNGYASNNPAKSVKNDKSSNEKSFEILTSDEIDTLIGMPSGSDDKSVRDRTILELLYATGMKVSELVSLDVSDYNETLSYIRCRSECESKDRAIPLYPKIKKMLSLYISRSRKALICDADEPALFVNINGARMTRQGLWKIIKVYASEAGINKDITPRALRHSFATHLLENGADVSQVKDILGHSDISTTNIYVNYLKNRVSGELLHFHPHA